MDELVIGHECALAGEHPAARAEVDIALAFLAVLPVGSAERRDVRLDAAFMDQLAEHLSRP
jgi:hypothetical protein